MTEKNLRIIFMGTPEFAVASLKALTDAGFHVIAAITAPDKPAGRGQQLHASPVKEFAIQQNIPVLQPTNLKAPEFIAALQSLHADLQVVVAFRMLPEVVWNMPPLGTLNVHASLLPKYRGAAPINHAIIQGETETGVTTFFLQHAIDTGDIISTKKVAIGPEDNAGTLHDKLMHAGAGLLVETVNQIASGNYTTQPQDHIQQSPAPKIFRADCRIKWDQPCRNVHNFIRGLSPHPVAYTEIGEKEYKIYSATCVPGSAGSKPGTLYSDGSTYLHISCTDGLLSIEEIQAPGKKRMDIATFLRGTKMF